MRQTRRLLIDWQVGFNAPFWGPRNKRETEVKAQSLTLDCRVQGTPVWHVHHHSVEPDRPLCAGSSGTEPMDFAKPLPGELIYKKSVNSGFIGTSFEAALSLGGEL